MPMLPPHPRIAGDRSVSRGPDWDALGYAALRADVEERIRGVCTDMAPDLLAELIDDICAMKVRWTAPQHGRGTHT